MASSTALVVLEGVGSFVPPRQAANFSKLSRVGIEGVVRDYLDMGCKVGMADELDYEAISEVGDRFGPIADIVLECTELGLVICEAIAIPRCSIEETKIRVKL